MSSKIFFHALMIAASLAAAGSGVGQTLPPPSTDEDFYGGGKHDPDKVALGRLLFFDKVLSGNRNISCATCHHALAFTGDGLALSVGEGGAGLGVTRNTGSGDAAIPERVPRNAPPLFNLGAREFRSLFHDGRVEVDPNEPSGFRSPAGDDLPSGLDNVLAAQAMFPVTSATEMAGQAGENAIADAAAAGNLAGPKGVWARLARRLRDLPEYRERFVRVFRLSGPKEISFVHAANALAAFEASAWRADNSPFDRYLRGDRRAMSAAQMRGMRIFFSASKGNCVVCHSGTWQTDHSFRAIAMPQVGPGKQDGASGYEDFGRERVSGRRADRYRFRVPSLRNVALTAPYGHAGAFDSLQAILRHHMKPDWSIENYDRSQLRVPPRADLDAQDFIVMDDPQLRARIRRASELPPTRLSDSELADLTEFLHALTDPASLDLRADVPLQVPSGIPLVE